MDTAYHTTESSRTVAQTSNKVIDLRSDTVTRPSVGMYDAMMSAPLGDDVYGEDESINALEHLVANMMGKEAALFVSSGTMSNLIAVLGHCGRGDELIVGDDYHIYIDEAGGPSVLGGIAVCPLTTDESGSLTATQIETAIKADDIHSPISRLLCLENTVHGSTQSPGQIKALVESAQTGGLSAHLDGARLINASIDLGVSPKILAAPFDTVSLCLSKGLGAPVGTVLSGTKAFIKRARRDRKLLGGGMRQAGILASAGIYALENNIDRLAEDHANARMLSEGLSAIDQLQVKQQTNMVFITAVNGSQPELQAYLSERGIVISAGVASIRLVTHLDINQSDIAYFIDVMTRYYR